jgi:prevent-host-death family protein
LGQVADDNVGIEPDHYRLRESAFAAAPAEAASPISSIVTRRRALTIPRNIEAGRFGNSTTLPSGWMKNNPCNESGLIQRPTTRTVSPACLAMVATGSYNFAMTTVSIKEAKDRLTALARRVEKGETVVVTRNGKPILDMVPHRKKGGINLKAIAAFKRKHGIRAIVTSIADDFDAPLPEDFLLRPLN